MSRIPHVLPWQRNAAPLLNIGAIGSVYNARCEPDLTTFSNMKLPAAETDY
jgi:hypothetical protein